MAVVPAIADWSRRVPSAPFYRVYSAGVGDKKTIQIGYFS